MQLCPNCGAKGDELEEIKEGTFYCPHCDETYTVAKGKPIADPQPKSVLQAMSDKIKALTEKQEQLEQKIQPQDKSVLKQMFGHLYE